MNPSVSQTASVPAHVPSHLVVDFNHLCQPGMESDVRSAFMTLRDGPELVYTPHNEGHWIATRYDLIKEVFNSPELFGSHPNQIPKSASSPVPAPFNEIDAPEHLKFRRLLAPLAGAKTVAGIETQAKELMVQIADSIQSKGACDFASEVASVFPISIIMRWLNLPMDDREMLIQQVDTLIGPNDSAAKQNAKHQIFTYAAKTVAMRRAQKGDDLISQLVHGEVDGRSVADLEATTMVATLIAGGLDTVRMNMSFFTLFLATHPEHRKQLVAHPELIPNAVEELLRYHSIPSIGRCVRQDTVFHGVTMKQGDMILCPFVLASNDPQVYPDPDTVDFNRKINGLLTFGAGPHFCPGAHLARIELRIFLTEWLKRIPDFELAPGQPPRTMGGVTMGVRSLPIVWPV